MLLELTFFIRGNFAALAMRVSSTCFSRRALLDIRDWAELINCSTPLYHDSIASTSMSMSIPPVLEEAMPVRGEAS